MLDLGIAYLLGIACGGLVFVVLAEYLDNND